MEKYLFMPVLLMIIIPSITLASWWNPISWFKSNASTINPKIEGIVIPEKDPLSISDNKPLENEPVIETKTEKVRENVKEKSVKNPIIQTITAQDPLLQEKIKQLELENQQLKLQIEKLNNKINSLGRQIEELEEVKNWHKERKESSVKASQEVAPEIKNPCSGTVCP